VRKKKKRLSTVAIIHFYYLVKCLLQNYLLFYCFGVTAEEFSRVLYNLLLGFIQIKVLLVFFF